MNDIFRRQKNNLYVKKEKKSVKFGANYEDSNNNSLYILIILFHVNIIGKSYFLFFLNILNILFLILFCNCKLYPET